MKKTITVDNLRSGQRVLDVQHGIMIHSGLAVVEGLLIKEPKEYIFYTDPEDENIEVVRIVTKDSNHVVELLT